MTGATGAGELARAVLEGVAMGLRDGLDALTADGSEVGELAMAGGGSRSPFWGGIIAAALERPLVWREDAAVGPALGAARLAQAAVVQASPDDLAVQRAEVARVEPDADLAARMAEKQARFRTLYAAVKGVWPEVG